MSTLYTFIRRPLPVAGTTYELKTYSPEEFANAFKLSRPSAEWAAAGNTLDDVVEFDDVEDAREFICNERQSCSITDEDADELLAELDKLAAVAGVECYESSITPLIESAENGAYIYALEAVKSLEAAQWIFDALQQHELSDEELDALMRRADVADALEYADICVAGVNTQDELIDAAQEQSEWICHCTNTYGRHEEFHGLMLGNAATEVLDLLASEIAECYEEI